MVGVGGTPERKGVLITVYTLQRYYVLVIAQVFKYSKRWLLPLYKIVCGSVKTAETNVQKISA